MESSQGIETPGAILEALSNIPPEDREEAKALFTACLMRVFDLPQPITFETSNGHETFVQAIYVRMRRLGLEGDDGLAYWVQIVIGITLWADRQDIDNPQICRQLFERARSNLAADPDAFADSDEDPL